MEEYTEGQRLLGSDGQVYVVRGGVPTHETGTTDVSRIVAPSPVRMAREAQDRARQEGSDARANAASERAADAASRAAQNDAVANQIKALEIKLKERELAGEDPKKANEDKDRLGRLNALSNQIRRVRELYNAGPGATDGFEGLLDYAPTNENAQFDTAGASLSAQGLAAFRTPGSGNVSDRDAIMFDRANLPTAATRDSAIEEQLRGLQNRVDEEYRTLGKPVPSWDVTKERTDKTSVMSVDAPTPAAQSVATGPTRMIRDDRLSSQVDSLVNNGASKAMIDAVLKKQGQSPLDAASYAAAKQWMKQNPGKKYFGADITKQEDMSMLQRASGSDAAAFVANAGNAATAGAMGALAGPAGQGALDAMSANSPASSFGGQLAGGMAGMLGAEAAVAARAPAALARYAPRIADTLYGATSGFNNAREGEGLEGALVGAGAGLAGNLVGTGIARGAGAIARGVRNEPAQYLRAQGIPLTVGQAVGGSGTIGAGIKKIEDAATSLPGVGNMIDARRMEGLEAFNRSAFDTAAAPGTNLTATGAEGLGQMRQGVQDAYGRALDPVRIDANDPAFIADMMATNAAAQRIPPVNGAQEAATASLQHRIDGAIDPMTDQMTGRGFQEAYRGLARTGRERAAGDYGHEVGQVMRQGQDALAGTLERQNPGAFDQFLEANAANRRMNVLATALKNAGNQSDELITPAQLNRADMQSTSRLEGQVSSAAGNRPFYDLATAGQEVLPSKLPDSGTWTRALVGGGATGVLGGGGAAIGGSEGATAGTGAGLGLSLLAALGGTRGMQAMATRALLDRPANLIRFGDILQQQARLGGTAGAATGAAINGY